MVWLERLVLAAILDDGISPGFLHDRLMNQDGPFIAFMQKHGIDPPGPQEISAILADLLSKQLVTCRAIAGERDEVLGVLPPGPFDADDLMFGLWFEVTPAGERIAIQALEAIKSSLPD